ncbi:MAG: cytochrome P450 [Deltaproteobacteria bacterium]|nr:cytochrome P450 [Deltaproteobacteria bacterium]
MPSAANQSARPYRSIPRAGFIRMLTTVITGQDRVDMLSRLRQQYEESGKVVAQNAGFIRMVNLYGPDANRLVLLDKDRIFSARQPWMWIMGRIFPNGLLLMDGEQHKQHRKTMHEAFTRAALHQYLQRMNLMIGDGLDSWLRAPRPFLAFRGFKELTLDIAASIFIGVELGNETKQMNGVFEDLVAASMSKVRLPIPGLEFHRGLRGRERMIQYFAREITKRRRAGGSDMLSRMCNAESDEGMRFGDQEIIDHMIFLMMAAHDTTTSTLTSMTYELGRNLEWQERVREECRSMKASHLEFDDIERLPNLSWVMKETLRRYPPLPVIPRVATADFEFERYTIPQGTMVVISPILTHHLTEWWDEPYRFDPLRFSPERAEDERHTHSWIPFGGGPHLCLGMRFAEMQVKAIMHQMVQRYRWSVADGYTMPIQQAPISKPLDGLPIKLEALQ